MELLDKMLAYEQEELNFAQAKELFQELLDTGLGEKLQGHYGRTMQSLLEMGYITPKETK